MTSIQEKIYSKADRFAKLSEKLSQIQVNNNLIKKFSKNIPLIKKLTNIIFHFYQSASYNETMNPSSKYNQLEIKVAEVDNKMNENFEILDKKYNNLKDQFLKLTKIFEEEKNIKESNKSKQTDDFKNLEIQIKSLLEEEQQNMQNFADNLINRVDLQISNIDKEYKLENEIIKNSINGLKESFEV